MKFFLLVVLYAVAVTASGIPIEERVNGENGWYVPCIDGSLEWVDMDAGDAFVKIKPMIGRLLLSNPVTFYLYTTNSTSDGEVIYASTNSISESQFDSANPTRICIHGWSNSKADYINTGVRDALLFNGEYNYIFVEWKRALSPTYLNSVSAVPGVGMKVAAFVDFMVENHDLKLDTLEIIGHSLGAHVAGYAGKNIASGKVHTIIGLDPALPLFNYDEPDKRLCNTDANYVESIQTNGGQLGFLKPIGKAAFYPNGGQSQPGCEQDATGGCSHGRAIEYYIQAVEKDNFATMKCSNYENAVAKACGSTYSSIRMGAADNADIADGAFFVPTNKYSPYGMLA